MEIREAGDPVKFAQKSAREEPAVLNRILENKPYKIVRKILITIVGVSIILIGAAMIFLIGPAIVVIPVGLAILATEFAWAKVLLHKLKKKVRWTHGEDDLT